MEVIWILAALILLLAVRLWQLEREVQAVHDATTLCIMVINAVLERINDPEEDGDE